MAIRETRKNGMEAVDLATQLLQRVRIADPLAGVFEAADVQWAWRTKRVSDDTEKAFWIDETGPVAGVLLTSFTPTTWQIDPVIVPGTTGIEPQHVWNRVLEHIQANPSLDFDVPVGDNDPTFSTMAQESGFKAGDRDSTGWLRAIDAPKQLPPREGFTLADRTQRAGAPHPLRDRTGDDIADRLMQCSLYDPSLDISIETDNGDVAGYSLYWFDPVTKVGLVEPVRVHDNFQRKGLARTMLTHGIQRLIGNGAERIKVSWETEAAGALYLGVGFQLTSTTTWYSATPQ